MASIQGTMVDSAGIAMTGARVALKRMDLSDPVGGGVSDLFLQDGVLLAECDGDGRFLFSGLEDGFYVLVARSGDLGARTTAVTYRERVGDEIVQVQPWGYCTGRVVDEIGNSVKGAVVMSAVCVAEGAVCVECDESISPVYDDSYSAFWAVLTDSDGTFRFEGPLGTNWRFVAHAPNFPPCASEHVPMGSQGVLIQLRGGTNIHGTVRHLDTLEPMKGFPLELCETTSGILHWSGETDGFGRFCIEMPSPGTYEITGGDCFECLVPTHVTFAVPAGASQYKLDLHGGQQAQVHGRIVDAETGEYVSGMRVVLSDDPEVAERGTLPSQPSRRSGEFRLDYVCPARYCFVVTEGRVYGDFSEPFDIVFGPTEVELRSGEVVDDIEIAIRLRPAVRGTLVDEDGLPVVDARVEVQDTEVWVDDFHFASTAVAHTAEDGAFCFRNIEPGQWNLFISREDIECQSMAVSIDVGIDGADDLRIVYKAGEGMDALLAKVKARLEELGDG